MAAPIADLALLSDCRSSALVCSDGAVTWWAAPRFDSPTVFCELLDPDAGHWSIRPRGRFDVTRRYVDDTLVLETTMRTAQATVRLTDALALRAGARGHEIGIDVPHALVRTVEVLGGDADIEIEFAPRPEYGLVMPRLVAGDGGLTTLGGPVRLVLRGDRLPEADGASARACLSMRAGERAGWVLHLVAGAYGAAPEPIDPRRAIDETVASWRSWSAMHGGYEGAHAAEVRFAGRVVQGLTHQPSGAVIAAATTSLPEIAGGDANWDYRFAWLRDAAMIARALSSSTCTDEALRYFDWIVRAAVSCRHSEHLQIVFGVEGERDLSEHELEHLAGYDGARPVRVGNAAWRQQQLDVLGHVLDCAWEIRDDLGTPDAFTADFLCQLADRAAKGWRKQDSSIWEGREGERHYTVSKLGCWVALDRAVRLAGRLGEHADPGRWGGARDEIRAVLLRDAWHEGRGAFTGALGSDHLDAGVMLLALSGFVDARDERVTRTLRVLEEELGEDGLLRRWSGAPDGAFLLASFWLSECHARAGRIDRAEAIFERAADTASDLGLLAEEVDPATGAALGNTPQAISHIGLVNAAAALTRARERQGVGA
ncbi:MAG: hypothetical protein QOI73_1766 [Solirubrobacteraceae bacterium]|nr:hypothetical protein [Solirubrobacteraceae bacterium]